VASDVVRCNAPAASALGCPATLAGCDWTSTPTCRPPGDGVGSEGALRLVDAASPMRSGLDVCLASAGIAARPPARRICSRAGGYVGPSGASRGAYSANRREEGKGKNGGASPVAACRTDDCAADAPLPGVDDRENASPPPTDPVKASCSGDGVLAPVVARGREDRECGGAGDGASSRPLAGANTACCSAVIVVELPARPPPLIRARLAGSHAVRKALWSVRGCGRLDAAMPVEMRAEAAADDTTLSLSPAAAAIAADRAVCAPAIAAS